MRTDETFTVRLDPTTAHRLAELASAQDSSADHLIVTAVEAFLERQAAQNTFMADALASLEHFERTGLHVTQEEVEAWFDELETNPDAEPPQCHV